MSVIAEYSVPAVDFVLGRVAGPDLTVELERLFGVEKLVVGYLLTSGEGHDAFARALRAEESIATLKRVDGVDDRRLYRCRCAPDEDTLLTALVSHDADVLLAEGSHETWSLHLRFPDSAALSDFQAYCVDAADVGLKLTRLYDPVEAPSPTGSDLTDTQRETLITAYEAGYFDIPRKITLVDLAEQLDVSDQAVSERVRRGEAKLIESHLLDG